MSVWFRNPLLSLVLLLVSGMALATTENADEAAYKLQAGDVIEVSVWREEGLQKELLIAPDGDISFPLIGSIKAEGSSVKQLRQTIIDKLSEFIPSPSVSVTLLQSAGNVFSVIGKVNRPGQFPMTQSTTVLHALSIAGGMTTYASENSIVVIRRGSQKAIPFRYGDIENGKKLEQNILLQSGDVVLVP
ncbi:MAG: polysaccharide export protein [Pseudomonadales bacterium]|nr:polysaccharide export protein [Pseudomonadales bacterium]